VVLSPFETGYPELIDSNDHTVKRLDHDPLRQQNLLFQHWRRYKNSEIAWSTFQRLARPIRDEFNSSLLRGRFSDNDRLTGFCNELWPRRRHLWTFLKIERVDPTNNAVERALRPTVIHRKLSFGTQSQSGSRYLERLPTVSETCRLQNRNAFEYLVAAMEAKFNGDRARSPLPATPSADQAA